VGEEVGEGDDDVVRDEVEEGEEDGEEVEECRRKEKSFGIS
jgi:hypothetical protein